MEFHPVTDISGAWIINPTRHGDERGYFIETFRRDLFQSAVSADIDFVQSNESLSRDAFILRGLHYQAPPYAQAKLVRCVQGKMRDAIVDVRPHSATYLNSFVIDLTSENGLQLYVPAGCLHGFVTLGPNTLVSYQVTNKYNHGADGSVCWNDKDLSVDWGIPIEQITVSEKDRAAPTFANWENPFGEIK